MSEEPDFISQVEWEMTPEQRTEWCRREAGDASEKGATFHRFSVHPEIPNLTLYEGWKVRPKDQGEQRWQMTPI